MEGEPSKLENAQSDATQTKAEELAPAAGASDTLGFDASNQGVGECSILFADSFGKHEFVC